MFPHKKCCTCCRCQQHGECITVYNPKRTCLIPNQINQIEIGPIVPIQTDCLLKVKESGLNPFEIVNKYVFPHSSTHMITLLVITASPYMYIIKPNALLASLCLVTLGSEMGIGKNYTFFYKNKTCIYQFYLLKLQKKADIEGK